MKNKVLIIGCGFLGNAIFQELINLNISVVGTRTKTCKEFHKLDVRVKTQVEELISKVNPEIIINCASNVNIEHLEKNPIDGYAVNTKGVEHIAKCANSKKIKLIHISSDGIFDGIKGNYSEYDLPNPLNEYAKSKLLGEKAVSTNCEEGIIIRTNFYGNHRKGKFLFNWIVDNLHNNREITGFSDIIFSPLEISNLSKMIVELIDVDYRGILNLASDTKLSKYELAKIISRKMGFSQNLIKEGTIDSFKFFAKRPKNTSLNNLKSKKILKTKEITLEEWLDTSKNDILK